MQKESTANEEEILKAREREDVDLCPIQIRKVCGHIVEGDAPERNLICKARRESFKTF